MRLYIDPKLNQRQGWILAKLEEGKNIEDIFNQSVGPGHNILAKVEKEVQEVLDITNFCGKAHPDSYVITHHAYIRIIQRLGILTREAIKDLIINMRDNGRLFKNENGQRSIVCDDIIWVVEGNKILSVFWDKKSIRHKSGLNYECDKQVESYAKTRINK